MRVALAWLIAGAAFAPAAIPDARGAVPIEGMWRTQSGEGVVRIGPCGAALCGWIVGLDLASGEAVPRNFEGISQCNLALITGLQESSTGVWQGTITNPRDGRHYDSRLTINASGRLELRGYVLVPLFGSTQTWSRYTGEVTRDCRMGSGR